ncbi:3-hydroxyisobutyrate dehydrogenase [Lolliginicoccus levis]|uniref:3-hydroxyisobutyrate dehydrogenase n=1 Tax=Lolliginicoccus levis TaxID=2919542 RepID=UPI00241F04E6|nr:3-hydroxyisobutyrate dehydrogenase [Lolliginicoccus levis]
MTTKDPLPTVAFIGLGHMGAPMCRNLATAGYPVTGFDVVPAALQVAREHGIATASSIEEAVSGADIVLTMLPGGRHVHEVLDHALPAARPGALFLECSTIDVADARRAHERIGHAGFHCVDAPVSGGVAGAEAGTLTFMVGGPDEAMEAARPLLDVMGRTIVHCGGPGAGQAAKICNNLILGITMIGVSEAFVLGEHLGLSHEALFAVASQASGQCWALTSYCPVPGPVPASPANRGYVPGFAVELMDKDLGLATSALRAHGVDGALAEQAAALYHRYLSEDGKGRDFSSIIEDVRRRSS